MMMTTEVWSTTAAGNAGTQTWQRKRNTTVQGLSTAGDDHATCGSGCTADTYQQPTGRAL